MNSPVGNPPDMERYHIFKLGLAILFYAAYCIRPMLVNGLRYNDLAQNNNRPKQVLKPEDYDVYYQGVDGVPGVDFPVLSYIPRTTFSCREIESGYYADLDTDCQVFHICEEGKKISFLCPNGTVFDQSDLICEWWYKVNCTNSPNLYQESAEHLREDLARRKASRRVSLDGNERNHGAVMRIEESSSVSAKQNGRRLEVSPSIKNIVTTNRVGGKNIEPSNPSHSNIPPQRAINRINGDQTQQKPKRYNDRETGNYGNNVNQAGPNKNLKEYHVQFAGTSPALDVASSEQFQHVFSRSTTPSSVANRFSTEGQTAYKKQSNGNRGSVKYNNRDGESRSSGSTLKPREEYDLQFPKHKSQITNDGFIKVDVGSKVEPNQKNTAAFTKNDIINRRLEPTDSDELQVPQETAAFVTNSHNSIQASTRKHPTTNFYPNHRTTYSDLKQPQSSFPTTKFYNGIKSVTPQYITTQSINNGKPFIGSTVGVNIYNGNSGRTTPSTPISSATIQPAIFISSISPLEDSSTKLAQIFASTFRPSISSTVAPTFESSTKRIVDHATVYGSFSKSTPTTSLPQSGTQVKFAEGVNKVGIHLSKSVGGAVTPSPSTSHDFGHGTVQTNGSDLVSITVSRTSPNINTKVGTSTAGRTTFRPRNFQSSTVAPESGTGGIRSGNYVSGTTTPSVEVDFSRTSTAGGTTFRPKYFPSTTVASRSGTGSIRSGNYVSGTTTPSVEVDFSQNGIGSTLVPGVSNFQSTTSSFSSASAVLGTLFNGATTVGNGGPVRPSLATDHGTGKSQLLVPEGPGVSIEANIFGAKPPAGSAEYSSTVHTPLSSADSKGTDGTHSPASPGNPQIVPEEPGPSYTEGNKSNDNPENGNSVLPSLLPLGRDENLQKTGLLVPSSNVGSATTVRGGKNYFNTLTPSVDSTGNSGLPNTLTLHEEPSNTRPHAEGSTPTPNSSVISSTNAVLLNTASIDKGNNLQGATGPSGGAGSTIISSIAPNTRTLSNSHIIPEKSGSQSNDGKYQYSSTISPHLPSYGFAQTTTRDKSAIESSTTTPTRATYLPKVNSTNRGLTTEANPQYSSSVILPPHLPSHPSANINDLDGTGAFFSVESSERPFNSDKATNEVNVSHNIVRSTQKPYTASTFKYGSTGTHSSLVNADIIDSNNFRTTQGFLTTVNPIGGKESASSNSGFYVTKNSVYGPSTPPPFGFSATPNYNEPTPVVNVSPNSGERDIQPPQITLSTPKFESSITLTKSETQWPRPFQKSPNSLDQQNAPVTPTYVNYQISSARPFKLPEGRATPVPTLPTPFTTAAPTQVSSVYENVDNMINVLKEIVKAKEQDFSSETPRPGLVIPPSAGPQTLHTLAVYFANALDGIAAERERLTGEELDEESKEKLTGLLTQMTMYRYNELFRKEADKEDDVTTTATTDDILEGEDSTNPIETPALRQLARNFSLALSSYLDNPEAFRRDLENLRPTEPPPLTEDVTKAGGVGEDELLNFSDADSKSSFPPVFSTAPSVSPTWGYIIASKPQSDLDISNSLNPDLNTADTQSFVPRYNNLAVNDKGFKKNSAKDNEKDLPGDHWTTSPSVTKLWQSALSVNPADLNKHFETTESIPHSTESDFTAPGALPSLNVPQTEIQYDLRALPKLSLNSTQVHGILIDFMNTTKADESNRLQRLLKKLNTTEGEFLDRMKEIESNPLTKRLILLLISECGANATEDLDEHSIHNLSDEILKTSQSSSVVAANSEAKLSVNSDIPTLVDPSLGEDDQDTRALQLLNSLYTIASKFGK